MLKKSILADSKKWLNKVKIDWVIKICCFPLSSFLERAIWEKKANRPWLSEHRKQRRLKARLKVRNPRALNHSKAFLWSRAHCRKMGSLWNRKCPKRIQTASAKLRCARTCSLVTANWRGNPRTLQNPLITWQASNPALEIRLSPTALCTGYLLPLHDEPSPQWLPPTFITFLTYESVSHKAAASYVLQSLADELKTLACYFLFQFAKHSHH